MTRDELTVMAAMKIDTATYTGKLLELFFDAAERFLANGEWRIGTAQELRDLQDGPAENKGQEEAEPYPRHQVQSQQRAGGQDREGVVAQDYRARLLIPEAGDPAMKLFTPAGTLIADGYVRAVIGGRGPYTRITTDR